MNSIKITEAQSAALGIDLERFTWLDAYFQRMIDEKKHPFEAIRVWRKNTLVFSGEYGIQTPAGDPLRPDAIYPIASTTKTIVATCAAILQEEGRVNFYEKLQDHFPEFTGEDKDRVLLWHLLCHSSGITDEAIEQFRTGYIEHETGKSWHGISDDGERRSLLMSLRPKLGLPDTEYSENAADEVWDTLALRAPLATLPGTAFSYWSYGYYVIKNIIERITGETLENYARRKIFEPLGMSDTHWVLPEEKRSRYVIRDAAFKAAAWINSVDWMNSTGAGGGIKSTMDDMARFGLMYLNNGKLDGKRIISPATVKLLTKNHNEGIPDSFWFGRWLSSSWGLGWDVKGDKIDDLGMLHSASSYNHGGLGGARLLVDPEYDLVVSIYMCEQREESVYDNMNCAIDILYGALD